MQNTLFLRRAIFLGAIILLLAQTTATLAIIDRAREAQIRAAEESVERISLATETSINRAFVQVDAMLAGLPAILAHFAPNDQLDMGVLNRVLRQLNNQNFTYRDILLLGPNGLPVATALPVSRRRRLPLPVETGFSDLVERGGGVSIGGPVQSPSTGEWTLFFARNVTVVGLGPVLAVAEVPVPSVRFLLTAAGESPGLRTTLERDDGVLLASVPHDETRIGQRLEPNARATGVGAQAVLTTSRFSGAPVFASVRPTLYSTLYITTTIEVDAALAGWYRDRIRAFIVSSMLGLVIVLVTLALMIMLRQRDKAEAERARARLTLENALEAMSDGFVMFDADDRLTACNSRYKDFYRISAPFIQPGATFDEIMREGAKRGQYPQAGDDIEAFVTESKVYHLGDQPTMERLLPDGRWVLITERRTPDGGTVGIRTDITALKRAIQELAAARDAAAAAGEAKSRFLARVSHELRTPLNGVLGFAQVLLQDPRLEPEQREQVKTLHEAGRHLLDLVNGLLDLSKIEAGRLDLAPRVIALRPLLDGCATLLAPEIARKSLSFHLDLDPALPVTAELDPTRLRQLLLNLLSNAVKFTPNGGRVDLRMRRLGEDRLRIEVQDTGPGVPAEKRHLLFEDFVQLAPHGAADGQGTGLGLAISARLVALMEGEIGCSEPPGGGALFWIEIPLHGAGLPVTEDAPSGDPSLAFEGETPLRILVVDDVAANRQIAQAMLRGAGHSVDVAADAVSALLALSNAPFDAVLMDLQMPGIDGFEATRRIRALPPPACAVPVIALTASALPDQIEATRRAGMDAHLAKPIDRQALLQILAALRIRDAAPAAKPAEAATAPAPYIDGTTLDLLERELGHAAHGILAEFVGEVRRALSLLTNAGTTEKADAGHVQHAAHRLVGAARTLGATRLAGEAEALQRAARGGDPSPDLQASVITIARATLPELEKRLGVDGVLGGIPAQGMPVS
ncbi:response regulator [Roseomonas terrae]|jgi:signal transduction histidine kinase/DNA-binding response OmpR family regulator|uniref:histidine kinase n=1 Tax=Neoroseomonas terrae TaxID=424799 RepID=A0ABS5EB08_9PROT|nr:ATP-binding protein [Neoroseomonas terrae]MBR0648208.1 response regulator [Neoroseomonas terrae]